MADSGDPHNFGQVVRKTKNNYFQKPRPLFWEWFFLSGGSPLRQYFKNSFLFQSFPELEVKFDDQTINSCGQISSFPQLNSRTSFDREDARKVGVTLAICSWFGIADLHVDNVAVGYDGERFIFAPLDIESACEDMSLLAQTLLVESPKIPVRYCGISTLLNKTEISNHVAEIADGFLQAFEYLNAHEAAILNILNEVRDIKKLRNRVIFNGTKEYLTAIKNKHFPVDRFAAEEIEQLMRGDVPYFFQTFDGDGYFYFKTLNQIEKFIPKPESLKGLSLLFYGDKYLRKNKDLLLKGSLLKIARIFDSKGEQVFEKSAKNIKINYFSNFLQIKTDQFFLKTDRFMRPVEVRI